MVGIMSNPRITKNHKNVPKLPECMFKKRPGRYNSSDIE